MGGEWKVAGLLLLAWLVIHFGGAYGVGAVVLAAIIGAVLYFSDRGDEPPQIWGEIDTAAEGSGLREIGILFDIETTRGCLSVTAPSMKRLPAGRSPSVVDCSNACRM